MNKLYTILFLFVSFFAFSQNNGINFQGVGRNSSGAVLATQKISLRFSVIQGSETGAVEYVESKEVITNAQGIFSVVIGDGTQISKTGNFTDVNWKINPKFLKVEMDPAGGTSFAAMGTTRLQSVPFAYYANGVNADKVDGVLSASQGGTGVASISALKTALGIDQINNTNDLAKPISTATQVALDTKVSTATFSTTVAIKANITDVELKAPIESPTFTGTVTGITKAMVGLPYVENTSDLSKPISTLTQIALDSKVSTNTFSSTVSLKENTANKSTAADLGGTTPSDIFYPTQKAVKEYIAANAASGGIADGGITNIKLADGAVNYAKFQSIPTNTILGNTTSSTAVVQAIATTGSDNVVLSTSPLINSPTLVTPNLGVATASSLNNITMSAAGGQPATLSVIGTASVKRDNNGDDAPNQRYENILTDGVVSLTTSQSIDGQKIFKNNLVLGTMGGIAGTNTPTTINFANGSRIGDIQNIEAENPDGFGSIDLYAPDGAKWVQMNYGNTNYFRIGQDDAGIDIGNNQWKFNNDGSTELPGGLYFKDDYDDEIKSDYEIAITSKDYLRLRFDDGVSYTRLGIYKDEAELFITNNDFDNSWNYKVDGSSWFPGDLHLGATSEGANKPGTIIFENGSLIGDIQNLDNEDPDIAGSIDLYAPDGAKWVQLNYGNYNYITLKDDVAIIQVDDKYWNFGDDGNTELPGNLFLNGNIETTGTLKLGSTLFPNASGALGDVLTVGASGNAIWMAPASSSGSGSIAGISSINNLSDLTQLFAVGTDGADFNISSASGTHTFNIPDASTNNRGLLNSTDYTRFNNKQDAMDYVTDSRDGYLRSVDFNIFNNKQDALTNPITGTGTSGQLSFFNGTSSMTSSSNLFWDENNKRLGIRNTSPSYPFEINQESDNYGFMLNAPSGNTWGSTIGFKSNIGNGNITNNGLFQLDGDGAMVFRTYQNQMYFDDFDVNGVINFRIGGEYGIKKGISLNNQGNLYVDGTVSSAGTVLTSDIRLKNNILPIKNSLHLINQLNPVSYNKKISLSSNDYSISENGFIAQELQKILPDLVHESVDKDKLLSVNYTAIIPILTKGIQEQQAIIEDQKKRLDTLEKLVNELIKKQ